MGERFGPLLQAKAYFGTGRLQVDAIDSYEAARGAGYDSDAVYLGDCRRVQLRSSGDAEGALSRRSIVSRAPSSKRPSILYQRGASTVASLGGNPEEVVALYERAVEADPAHPGALCSAWR